MLHRQFKPVLNFKNMFILSKMSVSKQIYIPINSDYTVCTLSDLSFKVHIHIQLFVATNHFYNSIIPVKMCYVSVLMHRQIYSDIFLWQTRNEMYMYNYKAVVLLAHRISAYKGYEMISHRYHKRYPTMTVKPVFPHILYSEILVFSNLYCYCF